jgi:hypothetical protein
MKSLGKKEFQFSRRAIICENWLPCKAGQWESQSFSLANIRSASMRFSGQNVPSGHMSQEEMPITLLFIGICSLIMAEKISGEHKFRRDFRLRCDQDQEAEGLTSTLHNGGQSQDSDFLTLLSRIVWKISVRTAFLSGRASRQCASSSSSASVPPAHDTTSTTWKNIVSTGDGFSQRIPTDLHGSLHVHLRH